MVTLVLLWLPSKFLNTVHSFRPIVDSVVVPSLLTSSATSLNSDVLGAAFCTPENVGERAFTPHLICVMKKGGNIRLNMMTVEDLGSGSVDIGKSIISETLPVEEFQGVDYEAPTLAMGNFPDAICCSLGNIIVVLLRASGAMIGYEFKKSSLSMIAKENVGHYIVDAVMRYSAIEGVAEVVMLLSDKENHKDGRIVSYFFRS